MNSFLNQIARWVFNQSDNKPQELLIVFPNRRSGVFFLQQYKEVVLESQLKKPVWVPKVKTINEFLVDYSHLRLAEPIELMADLYKLHQDVSGSHELFDDFYFWAEMMLNDFNDVDKYLVNADLVFTNVRDIKNMDDKTGFLSDEQISAIQRFFSTFSQMQHSVLQEKFLEVWEVLLPVYKQFKSLLTNKGIGYEGMIYREALQTIQNADAAMLGFKKVYFAGFNAITPCEEQIFLNLKDRKLASFFWDYDDYYLDNDYMEAGFFQRKYLKKFPHEPGFVSVSKLTDPLKSIQVISVPTNTGQVFKAAQILAELESADFSNTALVLADENLLFPTLSNLPENIETLNVTMGFPFSESLSGGFIQLLIQLQLNIKQSTKEHDCFYFKNVLALLQHPFLQTANFHNSTELVEFIRKNNLIQISENELSSNQLFKTIFSNNSSVSSFPVYVKEILNQLLNTELGLSGDERILMEKEIFFKSLLKINQLTQQIDTHNLNMQLPTYYRMVRKVLKQIRIPFEGEPISGLQLMGFLETRNLDFENVIVLSVNEGILPTTSHSPSFIPYSLRRGFGLPTKELHDAMYAYYFYRLLQKPKNIWLVYNSGVGGTVSGDKSRYIHQLQYDTNFTVGTSHVSQTVEVITRQSISVKKVDGVSKKLNQFLEANTTKSLSPSALSTYLTCPLRFYFKVIAGIKEPDETEEQVDARLFGSIIHLASEKFYNQFFKNSQLVTEQALIEIENNPFALDEWIKESFKEVLMGKESKRDFEVNGKNHIVFDVIRKYLYRLIQIDKTNAPFSIIGLEKKLQMPYTFELNGQPHSLVLSGFIDRLDLTHNGMRIVDYKTGNDKLTFDDLSDLFSHETKKNTKAVFQTFVYSTLVAFHYPQEQSIWPTVYKFNDFFKGNSFAVKSGKYAPFASGNFKTIEPEFAIGLSLLLSRIFDKEIPFYQTEEEKNCEYCPYKLICGR